MGTLCPSGQELGQPRVRLRSRMRWRPTVDTLSACGRERPSPLLIAPHVQPR